MDYHIFELLIMVLGKRAKLLRGYCYHNQVCTAVHVSLITMYFKFLAQVFI